MGLHIPVAFSFAILAYVTLVVVRPGMLSGSGPATLHGRNICVEGDEAQLQVQFCMYTSGGYVIPGTGHLQIERLASDQVATKTRSGRKAVLLKGTVFTARFTVAMPALQPPPGPGSPIPDATGIYSGRGRFVTSNSMFMGT